MSGLTFKVKMFQIFKRKRQPRNWIWFEGRVMRLFKSNLDQFFCSHWNVIRPITSSSTEHQLKAADTTLYLDPREFLSSFPFFWLNNYSSTLKTWQVKSDSDLRLIYDFTLQVNYKFAFEVSMIDSYVKKTQTYPGLNPIWMIAFTSSFFPIKIPEVYSDA